MQTIFQIPQALKGNAMTGKTKLDKLRQDNSFLAELPDTIRIPALGARTEEVLKPIETATLDDIAFAQLALQAKSSVLYGELDALRRVTEIARKNGALGADNVLDAVSEKKERK